MQNLGQLLLGKRGRKRQSMEEVRSSQVNVLIIAWFINNMLYNIHYKDYFVYIEHSVIKMDKHPQAGNLHYHQQNR